MFKLITKDNYVKEDISKLIEELFKGDKSSIANLEETMEHLDFIFSNSNNQSFLLMDMDNEKLIGMVNFLEYNNILKDWALFSIYVKKEYRNKGIAFNLINEGLKKVRKLNGNRIVSGIDENNFQSINLHKKLGFIDSGKMWNEIDDGFPENHKAFIYFTKYNTVKLETDRLIIDKGTIKDCMKIYEYDYNMCKGINGIDKLVKLDIPKNFMGDDEEKYYNEDCFKYQMYDWFMYLKHNRIPIGNIVADREIKDINAIEIAYNLHPDYWHKGYMTEAVKEVIKYLYSIGYDNVILTYEEGNIRSKKIIEKLGFNPYKETIQNNNIKCYSYIKRKEQ